MPFLASYALALLPQLSNVSRRLDMPCMCLLSHLHSMVELLKKASCRHSGADQRRGKSLDFVNRNFNCSEPCN